MSSSKNLLAVYDHGYLNHVQSSRRPESEALSRLELIWLTGRLAPDVKAIADSRSGNGEAIRWICKEFVLLCHRLAEVHGAAALKPTWPPATCQCRWA